MKLTINNTQDNCTPLVVKALCEEHYTEIEFEKGTYRFEKGKCFTGDFYPSNNASGEKNVIFPILNKNNVTIDGNGSTFMFCDRVFPFIIQNCENITLKNFIVDFSFARHAEATVVSSDEYGFELCIDRKKFEYRVDKHNLIFKAGSDEISTAEKKFFLADMNTTKVAPVYLFAGNTTDSKIGLAAKFLETDAFESESGVYLKFRDNSKKVIYPVGDKIFIGNDEKRENDVIFCEFSKNLIFENIKILRGAGMGIIAQLCTNIDVNHVDILPKENEQLSVTADALHFINCDGRLNITDCRIEKSIDDAVNIHGVYVLVDKIISSDTITIAFGHPEQNGLIPFLKGDKIYFENGSSNVKDISYNNNRNMITVQFEDDISSVLKEGDILENADRMADVYISGCTVLDCPHMRLSSKYMTISNNTLALDYNEILIDDLFDYWYESGCVYNAKIVSNKFISNKSKANIHIKSCRKNRNHKKIVIKDNCFANSSERAVNAANVDDLVMENNSFQSI